MTDVLSLDEYTAIANSLTPPSEAFINGGFKKGAGAAMPITNPATGDVITTIHQATAEDVDYAVGKARKAFDEGSWSRAHPSERKDVLIRLCKLITRNRHELAVMEAIDSGKPIRDCAEIDIPETITTIKWHAEAIDKIYDKTAPVGDDAMAMIVREPVGIVGCILPWNFPMLMLAWKIGPALAAGNSVIVKPAEQTPLTALRLAELAMEAGVPRGVFQVLPGDGPTTGQPIGLHGDIDMVSFTGSTETGRLFLSYAAQSNLKKVTLECGGKNPAIVLDDAEDLESVAGHIVNGAFWNMGQNCSATSRLIVHKDIKDALMEKIMAHVREWRQGNPLDPVNRMGVLVDQDHFGKVTSMIAAAKDAGHTPLVGGDSPDQAGVAPTIFDGVKPDDALARDEIFGPVLSVITVASAEQAIEIANDTNYGLAGAVFSGNMRKAMRLARAMRAGTVTVNSYGEGDITTPFGGYRESGFGGRDNSLAAHDQYTEMKTIWVDLSDNAPDEI
ncbi:MAG: aldehyde dehydrogenase [Alphaproteobacteria bacterium]|nr:aldehyde dehydrogenase [Alphaproteobacteria bacterium]